MAASSWFTPITRVFAHRNYALYMGGMTPNLITIWMQRVGVGWLAWEMTKSPTWLGVIAAADLMPMLLLAPIAGAMTDRYIPLTLQKITQVLSVLHALALAVFLFAGWMNIGILFGLTLFLGLTHTLASTARHAIVPATVPRAEFATAVAVDSALFNASRFIGPAIAGIVILQVGVGGTFAANVVGNLIFLGSMFFMDLEPPVREKKAGRNILRDVGESFSYVRNHAGIGPILFFMTLISVFIRPVQDMLPGFAGAVFDSGAVGLAWLTSGMGVGATMSATWIALRGRVSGLTSMVLFGFLGLSLSTLGLVPTNYLWVAIIFAVFSGFSLNAMSTGTQALVQYAVDDSKRGRVMGLYTLIYRGTPALGALGTGLLAECLGLRLTFAVAGGICLVMWFSTLSRRSTMTAALEAEHS